MSKQGKQHSHLCCLPGCKQQTEVLQIRRQRLNLFTLKQEGPFHKRKTDADDSRHSYLDMYLLLLFNRSFLYAQGNIWKYALTIPFGEIH